VAPTLLKIEGLTKRFGDRVAVAGCSLTIAEGEIVVIIGPSGCGKTTFLRCINRLEAPTAGSVVLRDEPIGGQMRDGRWRPFTESELASQRRRIGFVFQRFNLFNHLSALDNVAIGPHRVLGRPLAEARRIAAGQLERVFLAEHLEKRPAQLSGGQQQRVAIARCLAMTPELIGGILEEMKKLAESGMTMIVVTHEMGFAREVGDRLLFMDGGRIVEEGGARDVLAAPQNSRTQEFLRAIL